MENTVPAKNITDAIILDQVRVIAHFIITSLLYPLEDKFNEENRNHANAGANVYQSFDSSNPNMVFVNLAKIPFTVFIAY